ncbi:conserved hypothetical protein [Thiocapsa sp. KS1]|nr:hypothetical protein [Thiocapsa sp. KS1]CRI65759.1 conserved hypothetical protein [Thiocapsa sp. KS1]
MAEERFDLSYKGDLAPGADPASVRERLTAVFKLNAAGAERLFTGRPVIVKRNADAVAAARFTEVFEQAGAILTVTPLTTESESEAPDTVPASAPDRIPPPQQVSGDRASGAATLSLAAQDGFLEEPRTVNIAAFDTGGLNLVTGRDWSLADCEPPPTPIPMPDIGHLSLAEIEPPTERKEPAD